MNKIFGKIPFLKYTVALIVGVLLSAFVPINRVDIILLAFFALLFFILKKNWREKRHKEQWFISMLVFITIASLGFCYTQVFRSRLYNKDLPTTATFIGTIVEKNNANNLREKYTVKLSGAITNDSLVRAHEHLLVYCDDSLTNSKLHPGNQISFGANLHLLTSNKNPGEFNYQRFMQNKGIRYQAHLQTEIISLPYTKHSLKTLALHARENLLAHYRKYEIRNQEFAVLAALTLGEKSYLSSETKSSFTSSGAMHVLAVSGLHVGIIFVVISTLLKLLGKGKRSRLIKLALVLSLLWGYAFITGLSPSVLRACTMFSFMAIGDSLNRKTNIYNTLAVSAFVLIIVNPNIIGEVGFQLSYAAVASIVFFQPKISALFKPKNRLTKYLWDLFAVSFAAQIGTFPISIFYFHQFPVYFWMSNFVVIPAAGILLYSAMLFFATWFIPYMPQVLAFILMKTTGVMNAAISMIEALPGSLIQNIWIDKITLTILILLVISLTMLIENKQYKALVLNIILLLSLGINLVVDNIVSNKQNIIVIYNNYKQQTLSFISGKQHFYYSNSDSLSDQTLNMLEISSGYFHTNTPLPINKAPTNILSMHKSSILFKYLSIEIIKGDRSTENNINHDIEWEPKYSNITIKNPRKLELKYFEKGKIKLLNTGDSTLKFKTKECGSLLIFM